VSSTESEIEFSNGSIVRSLPASARGLRGGAWSVCVLDELGHFVNSESGNAAGSEILEAVRPSLAQFGDAGWLLAISTPRWKAGAFWELCERGRSGQYKSYHYKHLSTSQLNPAISAAWLAERQHEDPDSFRQEFLAEFIDGSSSYLNSSEILACVRPENILPPRDHHQYMAAVDPAYSMDNFALGIGHDEEGFTVIDGCWTWNKYGHEATVSEVAQILKTYGITSVRCDQHSPVPVQESFARHGIDAVYTPGPQRTRSKPTRV
jgi:hypothetical protein